MIRKKNIPEEIEKTFQSIDHIQDVKVSPFFKQKVLNRISQQKEVGSVFILPWFTPKLQLATLAAVIVVNVAVFIKINSVESESTSEIAEVYELISETETTLFD